MHKEFTHIQEKDMHKVAQYLLDIATQSVFSGATVIALQGDLGAGKTTTVQHLARLCGVQNHITSPTYVLQKTYATTGGVFDNFIHIDAYRISEKDVEDIGWSETIANPKNLVCVEWPENIHKALPEKHITAVFSYGENDTRNIRIAS